MLTIRNDRRRNTDATKIIINDNSMNVFATVIIIRQCGVHTAGVTRLARSPCADNPTMIHAREPLSEATRRPDANREERGRNSAENTPLNSSMKDDERRRVLVALSPIFLEIGAPVSRLREGEPTRGSLGSAERDLTTRKPCARKYAAGRSSHRLPARPFSRHSDEMTRV